MGREEEIIREIEELEESGMPDPEKWDRIIMLAMELGSILFEKK